MSAVADLPEAEADHGEGRARPPGGDVTDQDAENEFGQATQERHKDERHREAGVGMEEIDDVDGEIAGHAEIDGMAEGQQAALTEQHVVGARKDDEDADVAENGQPE